MAEKETATPKNIYEKMTTIKKKLQGLKKSGENKFSDYTYFDLGDILPTLLPALEEERLFMKTEFSATEPTAKLIILEMDNPESRIEYESKVGTCTLRASHDIQNLGAAQTYTRRYLIMNAFDITDVDIVDKGAGKEEPKGNQNKYQKQPQNNIETLKRKAWELIKRLPQDQQTVWIDSCKDADESVLNEIIHEVYLILESHNKVQPEKKQTQSADEKPAETKNQEPPKAKGKIDTEALDIY